MKYVEISRFAPLGYAAQEAMNTLCTNLTFSAANMRVIMMTSSHAAEGKSFMTMNIMRTMATYGRSVVLVDADLRRSYITSRYGLTFQANDQREGLAHYLAGMTDEYNVIYQTNIEGAYIVPIGREVSNPLALLNTDRFLTLLNHLAEMFDYVLVDAPPVGTVIDAAEISKSCDGALIAVSYNKVHRKELIEVRDQMEQTGCPVIGTVLNMVEYDNYLSRKYYYKSYYSNYGGYGYKRNDDSKSKRTKAKKK